MNHLNICSFLIVVSFSFGSTILKENHIADVSLRSSLPVAGRTGATGTCTDGLTAFVVLEKCFDATYTLIRKGLADDVATGHFQAAITDLKKFAVGIGKDKTVDKLKDVCIPADFYSRTFSVRWTTVYTESILDDMLMSISNSYYDVRNNSHKLPEITAQQHAQRDAHRNVLSTELDKPLDTMNVSLITLPKSIHHAYDEKNLKACIEWKKFTFAEKRTAKDGLRKLMYMVVQLIATGCDPNRSWQLIRHYSALVSLGIRCLKQEGDQLLIPDDFMKDYLAAAMRLSNEARKDGTAKPLIKIPEAVFDSCFKLMYDRLSTFGAWGQSDTMFTSDMVIKNMMSYVVHTVEYQLKIASDFYPADTTLNTSGRFFYDSRLRGIGNGPDCSSRRNRFHSLRCNTRGEFCFRGLQKVTYSWYENCCLKILCENIIQIAPTQETYESCCAKCNQFSCKPKLSRNTALRVPGSYHETTVIHVFLW